MDALTEYYEGGKAPVEEEAKANTSRTEIKELWSTMVPQAVIERAQALALAALPGAVPESHPRYQGMVKHPSGLMLYPVFDHMTSNYDIDEWRAVVIEGVQHLGMGKTPEEAIQNLRRYLMFSSYSEARDAYDRVFPGEP